MKTNYKIWALVFTLVFCYTIQAQNPEWLLYSAGGPVYSVDKEMDTVWASTNGGIMKINQTVGMGIIGVKSLGLPGNCVLYRIAIDSLGNKWIGTSGNGLLKYDGLSWTIYNISNSGLPNNNISWISIDKLGNKWIGTQGGGLAKFDGQAWKVFNASNSGLPDNNINCLSIDETGNKWIGTKDSGLVKYDDLSWKVYNASNSGFAHNGIECITIDKSGNKWIGIVEGGIAKYDDKNWTFYNPANSGLPSYEITCIAIDQQDNKWIGSAERGLTKFNNQTWVVYNITNSGLPDNFINCVFVDNLSIKWIGTVAGVSEYREGGILGVKEDDDRNTGTKPAGYALLQNYPNPFNPSTTIEYQIPNGGNVTLKVYDMLGREVTTLVNEYKPAGKYTAAFNGANLSSGVYLYKLSAGSYTTIRKMLLVK